MQKPESTDEESDTAFGTVETLRDPMHEPAPLRRSAGGMRKWALLAGVIVLLVVAWLVFGNKA